MLAGGDGIVGGLGAGYGGAHVTVPGSRAIHRDNLLGFSRCRLGPCVGGLAEEVTEEGTVVDHGLPQVLRGGRARSGAAADFLAAR